MFSIIIAAYEVEEFIEECLESIENQTYFKNNNDFEVILGVDGCLETLEKIQQIRKKFRNIKVFYMKKNYGLHITINTLINLVKFENIIKFDSDDIMFENFIEELSKNLDFDIIQYKYKNFKLNKESAILEKMFCTGSLFYKKEVFKKLGGYQNWICAADTELEIRFLKANLKILKINEPLFYRRIHEKSLTNSKLTGFKSKIRNEFQKKINEIGKDYPIFVKPETGEFEEIF